MGRSQLLLLTGPAAACATKPTPSAARFAPPAEGGRIVYRGAALTDGAGLNGLEGRGRFRTLAREVWGA